MDTKDVLAAKPDGGGAAERPWHRHYEPGAPRTIDYPLVPLHRLLEESAKRFPNRAATVFLGATLTYRQIDEAGNAFAAALADIGVRKDDRVALLLPNCPQDVIAYYGALKAGAVLVPTNPLYVEHELEHQFRDSGAETVVTLTKFYPILRKVQPRTAVKNVIVTNIKDFFPPLIRLLFTLAKEKKDGHRVKVDAGPGSYSFTDLLKTYAGRSHVANVGADDVALLQYTGGTTGLSKGAMLTHANLVANTVQTRRWLTDLQDGQEVMLAVLPFFHVYGMTVAMNMGVSCGATLVLLPRFDLHDVLKTINKHRPTIFPGVPTMYVAINNAPNVARYNLRSIRACISGAAALPVEVQQRFEELTGGKLVEGYGLTEASPVTHSNPIYGLRKAGSIGLPFPDVEAKIVDVDTGLADLGIGEVGELVVRGPQVMRGYWNMPEESARVLRNGWLHSGDIARMDQDGYFFIVDRKKDMIIAGGYNIYPRDVEEVLFQHPKVKEAVVAGVPDRYRGETVKAYVVLNDGETATEEEIVEFCRGRIARYKVPTAVEFRTELPKTLIGKVLRRILIEEEKTKMEAESQT
ncbi:MAG: long-chain fatty acid--CoA ligase [Chloroflexi bacterium]|nr:long-chain fatty acid--CoA ligase [Chloroflexota bacterium]